ncbi:MAG: ATP synthase F1 subunit epsilon [Acidobacteria bacterium]|nr:MAG: ATP synthase F1 subunit epsilon [Acidobacteriota bacterium]
MTNTLRLEIVTPEATVYSEPVEMVTLPAIEGQMGVLPQHGEGLVEVTNNQVSIVTNMAVAVESIDEAAAEEARQRAAARLKEKLSTEEVASVNAALARSLAQLNVKRRHR